MELSRWILRSFGETTQFVTGKDHGAKIEKQTGRAIAFWHRYQQFLGKVKATKQPLYSTDTRYRSYDMSENGLAVG